MIGADLNEEEAIRDKQENVQSVLDVPGFSGSAARYATE